jgi:hypothetical protein
MTAVIQGSEGNDDSLGTSNENNVYGEGNIINGLGGNDRIFGEYGGGY